MCLDTRYPPDVEKKMIAKLPDEFVVYRLVRKVQCRSGYNYYSRFGAIIKRSSFGRNAYKFKKGVNIALKKHRVYGWGEGGKKFFYVLYFHSFRTAKAAKKFSEGYTLCNTGTSCVIKARVRRADITSRGMQGNYQVIVSRKIIMPDPKDRKAVIA